MQEKESALDKRAKFLSEKELELEKREKALIEQEKKLGMHDPLKAYNAYLAEQKLIIEQNVYNPSESIYVQCRKGYIKKYLETYPIDLAIDKDKSEELLRSAATWGHFDILEQCLQANVDPSSKDHEALRESCRNGYHQIVKILLDSKKTWDFNGHAMWCAIQNKDNRMIELLKTVMCKI